MSSPEESMASSVHLAVDTEVICRAVTTATASEQISTVAATPLGGTQPNLAFFNGRYVDVTADGCDLYVLASDLTTGLSGATTGGLGTRGIPQLIPKDTTKPVLIAGKSGPYKYIQYAARSGSGFIRISPSSHQLNGK